MTEEGIRLLIGLALVAVAYGLALPYFVDPERYFVKRLRPADGGKVTHARLLVRNSGAVAVGGGLHMLAFFVAFDIPVSVFIESWGLAIMALGALAVVWGGGYAHFRLVKYRRLPPDDPDGGAFVLRNPKREEGDPLWRRWLRR